MLILTKARLSAVLQGTQTGLRVLENTRLFQSPSVLARRAKDAFTDLGHQFRQKPRSLNITAPPPTGASNASRQASKHLRSNPSRARPSLFDPQARTTLDRMEREATLKRRALEATELSSEEAEPVYHHTPEAAADWGMESRMMSRLSSPEGRERELLVMEFQHRLSDPEEARKCFAKIFCVAQEPPLEGEALPGHLSEEELQQAWEEARIASTAGLPPASATTRKVQEQAHRLLQQEQAFTNEIIAHIRKTNSSPSHALHSDQAIFAKLPQLHHPHQTAILNELYHARDYDGFVQVATALAQQATELDSSGRPSPHAVEAARTLTNREVILRYAQFINKGSHRNIPFSMGLLEASKAIPATQAQLKKIARVQTQEGMLLDIRARACQELEKAIQTGLGLASAHANFQACWGESVEVDLTSLQELRLESLEQAFQAYERAEQIASTPKNQQRLAICGLRLLRHDHDTSLLSHQAREHIQHAAYSSLMAALTVGAASTTLNHSETLMALKMAVLANSQEFEAVNASPNPAERSIQQLGKEGLPRLQAQCLRQAVRYHGEGLRGRAILDDIIFELTAFQQSIETPSEEIDQILQWIHHIRNAAPDSPHLLSDVQQIIHSLSPQAHTALEEFGTHIVGASDVLVENSYRTGRMIPQYAYLDQDRNQVRKITGSPLLKWIPKANRGDLRKDLHALQSELGGEFAHMNLDHLVVNTIHDTKVQARVMGVFWHHYMNAPLLQKVSAENPAHVHFDQAYLLQESIHGLLFPDAPVEERSISMERGKVAGSATSMGGLIKLRHSDCRGTNALQMFSLTVLLEDKKRSLKEKLLELERSNGSEEEVAQVVAELREANALVPIVLDGMRVYQQVEVKKPNNPDPRLGTDWAYYAPLVRDEHDDPYLGQRLEYLENHTIAALRNHETGEIFGADAFYLNIGAGEPWQVLSRDEATALGLDVQDLEHYPYYIAGKSYAVDRATGERKEIPIIVRANTFTPRVKDQKRAPRLLPSSTSSISFGRLLTRIEGRRRERVIMRCGLDQCQALDKALPPIIQLTPPGNRREPGYVEVVPKGTRAGFSLQPNYRHGRREHVSKEDRMAELAQRKRAFKGKKGR